MLNGVPRILIIRLSAIGDVVRVLPALHALRDRYPNAQIDWAVENKSVDIISGHPEIDQVLVFHRSHDFRAGVRAFRAFCRTVRDNRYDIVLDFHGILKSGLITRASRALERYGFARPRSQECSAFFTNRRVKLVSRQMNRIEENLVLVKALGAKRHTLDVVIQVPEDIQDHIDAYFEETFHGAKRLVAMHAPVDRREKQWPLENYAALADRLLADGRFEVLLTYGPGQVDVARKVAGLAWRNPTVAPETPDLKHYAWFVGRTDLFVGGDTGPMHIASAMGTPVVALFGGTDPAKHAPLRQPSTVLYAGPGQGPKPRKRRRAPADLFADITPEMVYDACIQLVMA